MLVRSAVALLLGALVASAQVPDRKLVGVWYAGPAARFPATALTDTHADAVRRDLAAIRRAGYNAITTWIPWAEAEPKAGGLDLSRWERLAHAAAAEELQLDVRVLTDMPPPWVPRDSAPGRLLTAVRERVAPAWQVRDAGQKTAGVDPDVIRVGAAAAGFAEARLAFWAAVSRGVPQVTFASATGGFGADLRALGETAGVVTRNDALFAPLVPRDGGIRAVTAAGGAAIDVRLLESSQALMIIAMNRAPAPHRARIAFDPDIPEAIWQNLETGAAVNFVMEKGGPFLEHTFAAHDVLVLMIRKTLR